MNATSRKTLYETVVETSNEYLGPAGERFIRRQIDNHLNITPEQIKKKDLKELIDWIKPAIALLTNDTGHVENFSNELRSLANKGE